ncbi:MAG: peptidyl-alpha-hydroxyglycine alpha-amidating lyase family protein [Pirellulales bacterium]
MPDLPALFGYGSFRYRLEPGWGRLPAGWSLVEVAGVAADSLDRIYVFNRGEHPVIVFDREGNFLSAWGEGVFTRPHGITISPDDLLWLTDDLGHCVRQCTPDGRILATLGTPDIPSDTGAEGFDYRTIRQVGPPFNKPTNVALAADGGLFIADGYGNARIHHFSATGELLSAWGGPGSKPGQFNVPHGIAIDAAGLVYVADRENSRIQIFDPQGNLQNIWTNVARPMQVRIDAAQNVFVAEVGFHAGMFPWNTAPDDAPGASVSVFNLRGELLSRWGGGPDPCAPGNFFAPHDLNLDSHGDIYVAEVAWSAGGCRGLVPADCHVLQKFVRAQ